MVSQRNTSQNGMFIEEVVCNVWRCPFTISVVEGASWREHELNKKYHGSSDTRQNSEHIVRKSHANQ